MSHIEEDVYKVLVVLDNKEKVSKTYRDLDFVNEPRNLQNLRSNSKTHVKRMFPWTQAPSLVALRVIVTAVTILSVD